MIKGTFNQIVKASAKFGGALVVFEGKPELLVGGFNFNKDDLPAPGDLVPFLRLASRLLLLRSEVLP